MVVLRSLQQIRSLNAWSAAITKPHRLSYLRMYPTLLIYPDGSSVTIRYHEPRQIIKLPINVWTLSEAERKAKIDSRKPKKKVVIEDDIEDNFDSSKYIKYLRK